MNSEPHSRPEEAVAQALLYEGYCLYPYRPSALKNRHRWTIGGLEPGSSLRAECLVRCDEASILSLRVRFLHPLLRSVGDGFPTQEATERAIAIPDSPIVDLFTPWQIPFDFQSTLKREGTVQRRQQAVEGTVEISAAQVAERVYRISVRVRNHTPLDAETDREEAALRSLASAHIALRIRCGEFLSLTDPPNEFRVLAADCRNEGVWPVLVGDPGQCDSMLAVPIILPDFPSIAPESSGDFFDGTEIDEMLALRVLTLTDSEKQEIVGSDPRAEAIVARVESLSEEEMRRLHGTDRSVCRATRPRPGETVRLRPRGRADAFDFLLAGKLATIVSIEEDFEGTTHLAVTVDEDPGRDLGELGQPGHRFFFRLDEVEPLKPGEAP